MKQVIAIDLPWLALMDNNNVELLMDTLETTLQKGCVLLLCENLYNILPNSFWEKECACLFSDLITKVNAISYGADTYSPYITHNPILTDNSFGKDINHTIDELCCALHTKRDLETAVMVLNRKGWERVTQLVTTKDRLDKRHTLIHASVQPLENWLQGCQPQLYEYKHFGNSYNRGGYVVSSFRAGADMKYATKLLDKAYSEYEGTELEPQYLYTYDDRNGCFVQFRNDHNKAYHGMDLKTDGQISQVPENIRMKYHK